MRSRVGQRARSIFAMAWALLGASSMASEHTPKVVSLGGGVTEIVYALGAQSLLIGTDLSSTYPEQARALPNVGYYRKLPAEGIVSLRPTLVIASENAGPPQAIEHLKAMNIKVLTVPDAPTVDSLKTRVRQIGQALDQETEAEALIHQFERDLARATAGKKSALSAMTVVIRGGKMLGAGRETNADVVIQTAGLRNALASQKSYRPLSAEAVTRIAPEVIIVTSGTVKSMGTLQAVKDSPLLKHTPAVKNNRIIELEDSLAQGFGLRLPNAVAKIREGISLESQP
jgi:iron complex transport system substrate-binding protein